MPKLDTRLLAVANQIRSNVHVDIGSDHGNLLVSLLAGKKIKFGIAIENNDQPFHNSARALKGLNAEVRFGDGLDVLKEGEADSLSICGMGVKSMLTILGAHPNRIPAQLVLQTEHPPEPIRHWALNHGYYLIDEQFIGKRRPYHVLTFQRAEDSQKTDPAYRNIDRQAALLFGPLILKRFDPAFESRLREEEIYWKQFDRLETHRKKKLQLIRKILADRD